MKRLRHLAALGVLWLWAATPVCALDFAQLQSLIETEKISSIEALLPRLAPADRYNYVLVFDSRSLQGASYQNPRALMYGSDAKFIFTFNGEAQQRGFEQLETMEFDARSQRFVFREIEFRHDKTGTSQVVFSEPNPPVCLGCHGNPPRPVWDTPPLWPGVYGERYARPLSDEEREGLTRFTQQKSEHPRYRHLLNLENYARPAAFFADSLLRYQATTSEPPNAQLSSLLGYMNLVSIAAQIERSPKFPAYRYALLGSLSNGCASAELVPQSLRSAYRETYEDFQTRTLSANRQQRERKLQRTLGKDSASLIASSGESLDRFRYLVEQGLGVSTAEWTLALEKNTFDFATPGQVRVELEQILYKRLGSEDPALQKLRDLDNMSMSDRYCSYLRRKSQAALSALAESVNQPASLNLQR